MTNQILVIDDDPAVRNAFKLILEADDYTVREAESGLKGIEMAKAERPDLIFLDLRMPGIDGVETLRQLKAYDQSLTIYIVTAFSSEYLDQLKSVRDEGVVFELASKPLSSKQIRNIAHIARTARVAQAVETPHKLVLTLYVVSLTPETKKLIEQLTAVISSLYPPSQWLFDVIEVLDMPEKAVEKDVFATPMLVRDVPVPVLKLLGDLSKMSSVMTAITSETQATGSQTVII